MSKRQNKFNKNQTGQTKVYTLKTLNSNNNELNNYNNSNLYDKNIIEIPINVKQNEIDKYMDKFGAYYFIKNKINTLLNITIIEYNNKFRNRLNKNNIKTSFYQFLYIYYIILIFQHFIISILSNNKYDFIKYGSSSIIIKINQTGYSKLYETSNSKAKPDKIYINGEEQNNTDSEQYFENANNII